MSCELENDIPVLRCDRCKMTNTDIYGAPEKYSETSGYEDLCILCISSIEEIELVVDEDSGFAKLMSVEEIERLTAEF